MSSEFHIFARAVNARFDQMSKGELFTVEHGDLFETYLAAFPAGTNPLFRVRTWHDCSCCKNFVRNIGHVVSLADGKVSTVWDIKDLPYPYDQIAKTLGDVVRQMPIRGLYRTIEKKYGNQKTVEHKDGQVNQYHHFYCEVASSHRSTMPAKDIGDFGTTAKVVHRGLRELKIADAETVIDLIDSNSIYRGSEHRQDVINWMSLKQTYDAAADKDLFVWLNVKAPGARIKNTVIGSLLEDLADGIDLEKAVKRFETKVAPENYKRSSSLITPKMIDQAVEKLKELDLESAIQRRLATLADVSINSVLFVDNSVKGQMKDGLAGLLMEAVKPGKVDIKHAEKITIDDFLTRIVPQASSIDLLVKNAHLPQFMTVTAPADPSAGQLFKWNNGFAWSYDGDVADSIKAKVKRAGGNVDDAALRISLAWSNTDDLDLHASAPGIGHIFYGAKAGVLDVDMNNGWSALSREPVENLSWRVLRDGVYTAWVHQYRRRESIDPGFTIEVAYGNETLHYTYEKPVIGDVACLTIEIKGGQVVKVTHGQHLQAGSASQNKWGVDTETLVPVDTLMTSPNHWDDQAIGHKHWFFILKGCKTPEPVRGIYNEFLSSKLEPHRKVFEVLGAKTKCPTAQDQLSGVGFTSARGDQATVVVKGSRINKAFDIQF